MINSVRDAFMVALTYLGYNQNTTDEAELNEALSLLQKQYPLVQAYVVDQVRDKMIGEEAALGVIYSGEAIYTQRENENLVYVVPKEGSNVWFDGWLSQKLRKIKKMRKHGSTFYAALMSLWQILIILRIPHQTRQPAN